MANHKNTEFKIIEAAKEVFVHKGFDGARMQEIADTAGINKSLLHYYFRSKTKLFEKVFHVLFAELAIGIVKSIEGSNTIEELIEGIVGIYFERLIAMPYLPQFVLHELNRNPELIVEFMQDKGIDKTKLVDLLVKESQRDDLRDFNPIQVFISILAMTIFPFIGSSIITGFIFDGDKKLFDDFIAERKEHVLKFVKVAIFKNNE